MGSEPSGLFLSFIDRHRAELPISQQRMEPMVQVCVRVFSSFHVFDLHFFVEM